MTTRVYGWTVQIDRIMKDGMLAEVEELARRYGVPVTYTVSIPAATVHLEINGTDASSDFTSLVQLATFALLLTAVLDGRSLEDICHRLVNDAKPVLRKLTGPSAA